MSAFNNEPKEEEKSYLNISLIPVLKKSFHTLSLTLLTLLLPLSFLLLSKLTVSPSVSSLHYTILRLFIFSLSISSLLNSLTGFVPNPYPWIAWASIITFQACITLGIESAIAQGIIKAQSPGHFTNIAWIKRVMFFVGLYQTMLHWKEVFVKMVVDDTVYGMDVKEGRVDRVAIGAAFSGLWVWMLRDEVEIIVMTSFVVGGGLSAYVIWVVGLFTLVIGVMRVVDLVFGLASWLLLVLWHRRRASFVPTGRIASDADDIVLLV